MIDETPGVSSDGMEPRAKGVAVRAADIKAWFVREILPLEAMLMRYLHKNWRNESDIEDLRQEVYAQVLREAESGIPERAKAFLFAKARNVMIDRFRKENVIPIELGMDMELSGVPADEPGPERTAYARDTLRRLQLALNELPPRYREALLMTRVNGLSRREIAQRMGISEQAVSNYVHRGMFVLADLLYGERTILGGEHDLS
jgi:RNA polymerase sigma-70 factor (ECF subfamily)